MRIIFMGTPEFAVPSLERLAHAGYRPVAVVTGPDRPRGRGQVVTPTPVKQAALRLGIETVLQPESVKDPAFADEIRRLEPDLIVVVAFRILPAAVFTSARLGAFNLHGSLLPKYRGAAPINHAVMHGEPETGVTTFFLKEQVDTGNIILKKSLPIGPDETAGEVHDRMMEIGADAVLETVRLIDRGEAVPLPQDDALSTPAPKIHREDCRIRWDRPADVVHNQIRGLSPHPGAWTMHDENLLKIYRTRQSGPPHTATTPGEIVEVGERLIVACSEGTLEILELQQEGRKALRAEEFLRGYLLPNGDVLQSHSSNESPVQTYKAEPEGERDSR
ncbi:MAG: methionyl-tRNA formyltransferase [Rhodothermales bacterium]